jgi:hypothetical protein
MTGPGEARRKVLLGWALFGLFVVIFGATFGLAWLYLAFD